MAPARWSGQRFIEWLYAVPLMRISVFTASSHSLRSSGRLISFGGSARMFCWLAINVHLDSDAFSCDAIVWSVGSY